MKSILFIALIIGTLSNVRKPVVGQIADIFKGVKNKIYKCVANSGEASEQLKELALKNLNSDEEKPLNFHSIELSKEDIKIIRNCKKEAFRAKAVNGNSVITPISVGQAVHKNKKLFVESGQLRKLSVLEYGRLGSFNIRGIFPCIENGQPAIKIIRDSVNFWRNKDYTTAVINIYDNISVISQGFSYCINAIFPSD